MNRKPSTINLARYRASLALVREMDSRLSRGYHERDILGRPIYTIDQLMAAIEAGRWPADKRRR